MTVLVVTVLHYEVYTDNTVVCLFFFFKQKTAYEMRISDWSSDVCSSDLGAGGLDDRRHSGNAGDAGFLRRTRHRRRHRDDPRGSGQRGIRADAREQCEVTVRDGERHAGRRGVSRASRGRGSVPQDGHPGSVERGPPLDRERGGEGTGGSVRV